MSKQIVTISVLALAAFGGCDRPQSTSTNAQSMSGPSTATSSGNGLGGGPMTGGPMTETPMGSGADESTGGGPKAEMVSVASATDRIAEAHCKVALSCEKTKDIKAKGIEACMHASRDDSAKTVNASSCAYGIDQAKLTACLDKLSKTSCDAIHATVDTVDACKSSALCP
jgi:hypothetical protein